MSAETEGVGDAERDGRLDGHVWRVVEVALRVRGVEVDGGGDDALAQRKYRGDGLGGAGGAEHVARHALDAGDVGAVGVLAEGELVGRGFGEVVEVRSRAVGVDVEAVLCGVVAGLVEALAYAVRLGGAFRPGGGGVVGVAGVAVAHNLGVNLRAALKCVLEALENEDGAAVAHYEAPPVRVERERGVLRVGGPGEGLGVCEAGDSEGNGGILAAAGDDCVGMPSGDRPECLAEAVGGGRAGGDYVEAGALGHVLDGHVPRRDVAYHRGDEERGNPLSAGVLDHLGDFAEHDFEAAYAGTHVHAEAEGVDVGVFALAAEAGVRHGLVCSRHPVLGEHALLAREGLVHAVLLGVEVLDLAGDMDRENGGVVFGDGLDAAHALLEVLPEGGHVVPDWGDDAETGDYYSVLFHDKLLLAVVA